MGVTPVDLYRAGNATGPRMDHVRSGRDIVVTQIGGADWVYPMCGGVSTVEKMHRQFKTWWHIPQGTIFTDLLVVRNDYTNHWSWEPAQAMEISEYVRLLAGLNAEFVPA